MQTYKKNINSIADELIHNATTHRQKLIAHDENHKGDISTMNHAWLDQGKQLETHEHPDGEEFYFFLAGTGQMLVGSEWFPVVKGDFVTVPQKNPQSLKNNGNEKLVFINVRTLINHNTQ